MTLLSSLWMSMIAEMPAMQGLQSSVAAQAKLRQQRSNKVAFIFGGGLFGLTINDRVPFQMCSKGDVEARGNKCSVTYLGPLFLKLIPSND